MRIAVVLIEGLTGAPSDALTGRTPLDHARTPHLDALASRGSVGRATVESTASAAGVEAALAGMLGAGPAALPGRGAFDAIGAGHPRAERGRVAAARFLTTFDRRIVGCDGAGLRENEARALCDTINERLGGADCELTPVGGNQAVLDLGPVGGPLPWTAPPERLGRRSVDSALPSGEGAERLTRLMSGVGELLEQHPVNVVRLDLGEPPVDTLWVWGVADLPLSSDPLGASGPPKGGLVTRTLWAAGMARAFGYEPVGERAGVSADDAATGRAALDAIGRYSLVVVHCAGPRWAAQKLDPVEHAWAISSVDEHVVGPLRSALGERFDRLAVVGCNPVGGPFHIGLEAGPSPFLVAEVGRETRDLRFDERAAAASALVAPDAGQLREFIIAGR